MTLNEAYAKAEKIKNRNVLLSCWDIGDKWAFEFRASIPVRDYSGSVKGVIWGLPLYDMFDKKTGEHTCVQTFPLKTDKNHTPITVEQFPKGYVLPKLSKLDSFLIKFFGKKA